MASHSEHHDHHSNEKKPVAFTVPLIFGSVVILAILLLVSLGDPKPGCHGDSAHCEKEGKECCEKPGSEGCEHEKGHGDAHAATAEEHAAPAVDSAAAHAPAADTASKAAPAAHAEGHH